MKKMFQKSKGLSRATCPESRRGKSKGFTMVEILVVMFIFSSVMIIASSSLAQGFLTGRLHSTSSQETNRSLSLVFDIIGQKMANANLSVAIPGVTEKVNGFGYQGTRLIIASKGGDDVKKCSFYEWQVDKVMMAQNDCSSVPVNLDNRVTTDKIKITSFDFTTESVLLNTGQSPYLSLDISAEDAITKTKMSMETIYNIPYTTYKGWE